MLKVAGHIKERIIEARAVLLDELLLEDDPRHSYREVAFSNPEREESLERWCGCLQGRERFAFDLFYIDGMTNVEVQEVLRISLGAVRSLKFRIDCKLRRCILREREKERGEGWA